jgi:hypothetical protein
MKIQEKLTTLYLVFFLQFLRTSFTRSNKLIRKKMTLVKTMAGRVEDLRDERKWFAENCGTGGQLKLLANLVILYE